MLYPDWQWKFWLRSIFFPKSDLVYTKSKHGKKSATICQREAEFGIRGWPISGSALAAVASGLIAPEARNGNAKTLQNMIEIFKCWVSSVGRKS